MSVNKRTKRSRILPGPGTKSIAAPQTTVKRRAKKKSRGATSRQTKQRRHGATVNGKATPDKPVSKAFRGLSINFGTVLAQACLYSAERHRHVIEAPLRSEADVTRELKRFHTAIDACGAELDRIAANAEKAVGKTEAEIFVTQKHIMTDPGIVERVESVIRDDKKNAEYAIDKAYTHFQRQFEQLDNTYIRERASDISEVRSRLLNHLHELRPGFLCEGQMHCSRGRNRIIVAEELTPDMVLHMDLEKVRGFVTEHGGFSSHAAIIARSLGIPAVSGLHGFLDHIRCGDKVLIDGDTGMAYLNPDESLIAALAPKRRPEEETIQVLSSPAGTEVLANASLIEDVRMARAAHADGIGLFRTEILFMKQNRLLSEGEQYEHYRQVVELMGESPVVFRLLDVGGDKPLPFFRIEQEANPYLGWRGARFLLGSPDILATQVRALARASNHGKIKIMYPMVIDGVQAGELSRAVAEIVSAAGGSMENIETGAMFEVPSACFDSRAIFKHVEFGSIGSNDLIQYLFAIDRNNERVSYDYNPEHPILWHMLSRLSETARGLHKPLSICGEMAAREGIPTRLVETGITSLSVSPRLIGRVRCELAKKCKPPAGEQASEKRTHRRGKAVQHGS